MYATVTELRDEGVTEAQASDARLLRLIDEASRLIDRGTGWFFEPRPMTLLLDGRGTPSVELPVPPIHLDQLMVGGGALSLDPESLVVVGAPVQPGFDGPRLTLRGGCFPKGYANIEARGLWGYTEDDGSAEGRTPLEIRRATILLVLRTLPLMGDTDAAGEARNRWRILEERTRDQSYKLDRVSRSGVLTGDPEVDEILVRYRRPAPMGAA